MISMRIMSNSNATKNVYSNNKSRLLDNGHDNGLFSKSSTQQITGNSFIGNSLFTRISNTLPSIKGTSNDKICDLINVYDVIKQPNESNDVLDTKECHVVMPKLNKSLDVHLNKTKTINLKRLQHLVAKNIIKIDSLSLNATPARSNAQTAVKCTISQIDANCNNIDCKNNSGFTLSQTEMPTHKMDEEKACYCIQNTDECRDVLNEILNRVCANVCKENFVTDINAQIITLEEDQQSIHSLVDKIVTELSNNIKPKRKLDKADAENVKSDIKEQVEIIETCSQSSDYGSLKLSLDCESEHEENQGTVTEGTDICGELSGNQTESTHTFVLKWLDTDRLPTPSPPPTTESIQIETTKSPEFIDQMQVNNKVTVDNSCALDDTDNQQTADFDDVICSPLENKNDPGISIDKMSNDELKLKPIKLYLKDIQKANSDKMLVKMAKRFHRLTLNEGQIINSSEQMSQCKEETEVHTPKIVMFATVDNNCVIENLNFSDNNEKDSLEVSQHESNKVVEPNLIESKVEKEKSTKSEQLSFDILQSKVDEMSKKLQFDLEDTISFMKSTVTLLKDEKWNIKRKRSGQTCKKIKRKHLKEENKETKESSYLLTNSVVFLTDHKSCDSNIDTSDEEFCPTDCEMGIDKTSTIQTRSQIFSSKTDSDNSSLIYKKKLRKRQSINFLEDVYSSDFNSDEASPTESKKQKHKRQKLTKNDNEKDTSTALSENQTEKEDQKLNIPKTEKEDQKLNTSETEKEDQKLNTPETEKEKFDFLDIDTQVARIVATVIAPQTNTAICSIKKTSQTSINSSSSALKLSTIIELTKERYKQTDDVPLKSINNETEKPLLETNSSSIANNNNELIVDVPLDLSKKIIVEQTRNADTIKNCKRDLVVPEKNAVVSISNPKPKSPEIQQIKNMSVDNNINQEEIMQSIKSLDNQVDQLQQQKSATQFQPTASQIGAFSFPNYNAKLFQTEYQKLQKELAALDFVAEQKQRECNNILQLKKHRIIAMQQLQLRKQLLLQVQRPNNSPVSSITAATITTASSAVHAKEPFMMSTASSMVYSNPNYEMRGPPARLSTSTKVTPARPNGVIVRPIVTKPVVTNAQVLPIRPNIKPVYNPKAIIPPNWPPNRLGKSNADYWNQINTMQTVVARSNEKWLNEQRVTSFTSVATAIAAQTPLVNGEIVPITSSGLCGLTSQNKETYSNCSNINRANKVPISFQHSTLAQLLTSNQSTDKINNIQKPTPRWPSCQSCKHQTARYICAGCNKQWYCSEKCQIADWKTHFKTCKK